MKPILKFETKPYMAAGRGPEASIPNLLGMANMQNKSAFFLDEQDEIYEAYGKLFNIYPYRDYLSYTRECKICPVKTAILENQYLKAIFLPEYGGRLWQLTDKQTGRELLFTNDVIRPSNLALRDAWFSGGVEWNLGMIGHSPLTMDPMFTAVLTNDKGAPVLRMYEYERIRRMVYQMDFWLDEEDMFLNCRMRVVNHNPEVTPMYWWSNMAVPEYEGGRLAAPAETAYTSDKSGVYKVAIPMVEGNDVTAYKTIPHPVDYFFNIPEEAPRYIANLDANGYGLLQYSTRRLRGRKLFSWGNGSASGRWQDFLTEKAGRYIEVQAGLGKTQYGCIPMAPHTAWEWIERYGAVDTHGRAASFEEERDRMTARVAKLAGAELEQALTDSRAWAMKPGEVIYRGSGYAGLENMCRACREEVPLSPHLDFTSDDERQSPWKAFLTTGILPSPAGSEEPADCMADDFWNELLLQHSETADWHLLYHLALNYLHRGDRSMSEELFSQSLFLEETPWSLYGLAATLALEGRGGEAAPLMEQGLLLRMDDLSYVKEGFHVLERSGGYENLLAVYEQIPPAIAAESRIRLYYILALTRTGQYQKAYDNLTADGGLVVASLREGENSIAELWLELREKLGLPLETVPYLFDFKTL